MIPVVIYGVKSSPDEKESVADQHRIVLEAIEREGDRDVIGTYGEANMSGYRRERGPELEAAMTAARQAAAEHGEAELWVFHSSRLARGDGRKGRRGLGKIVFDLLYDDVTVRSVSDPEMVTPMLAGIAGKSNHEYSAALSAHTTRGIHKRQREGQAFGTIPTGYRAVQVTNPDGTVKTNGGRIVTERIIDPHGAEIVERVLSAVEAGQGWCDIARALNAAGFRTPPRADRPNGGLWTRETVRQLAKRRLYTGEEGYPRLIDPERFERVQALITESTPAARQRRKGGRPLLADGFLLRGMTFCGHCGEPMNVRSESRGYYTCRAKRRGTGHCDSRPIPAQLLDGRVLEHLETFLASVEAWIAGQVANRNDERAARQRGLDEATAALARLDAERDKLLTKVRALLADDQDAKADMVLAAVEQVDTDRAARQQEVADAEAALAEWPATPDVDVALDYYREMSQAVHGRVSGSQTVSELRAALSTILAGVWVKYDGTTLDARFSLRGLDDHPHASQGARDMADYAERTGEPDKRWMLDPVDWLTARTRPSDGVQPAARGRCSRRRASRRSARRHGARDRGPGRRWPAWW